MAQGGFVVLGKIFSIPNYFCGNKSVFASLNTTRGTGKYDFGCLPCKTPTASGDFFSPKMLNPKTLKAF